MVSQSERPMDFLPKVFHDLAISHPPEAAARLARTPTWLADLHSRTTWRDWKVSFGQFLGFCSKVDISSSRFSEIMREKTCVKDSQGTSSLIKNFFISNPSSPTPHLPTAFSQTKIHLWVKQSNPGMSSPTKLPRSKQPPWLVDPVGLLASTLLLLPFPVPWFATACQFPSLKRPGQFRTRGWCQPDTQEHRDLLNTAAKRDGLKWFSSLIFSARCDQSIRKQRGTEGVGANWQIHSLPVLHSLPQTQRLSF